MPPTERLRVYSTGRAYRIDRSGHLVWQWEENFNRGNIDMANTVASKIKKNIKIECNFCKKKILYKVYTFKKGEKIYNSCSACKFLFGIIYEEIASDRFDVVRRMFTYALIDKRHCKTCRQFRLDREHECRRGKFTGIGKRATCNYPFSYANHGCRHFEKIRMGASW